MFLFKAVCLCGAVLAATAQSDDVESRLVHTAQGSVRGYKDPGGGIFAFYSIPYATAPTGPDRFKAPRPPQVRLQTLEAVDKGIVCPQTAMGYINLATKSMQEDCLIANIYVPDTEDKNLPVVVFIHGGAFHIGYGDAMSPKYFSKNKKIIAVTFNYRLGINGFLCLGTKDVPGNAGLKDQVALLRWVESNIAAFGGNPHDVTLAGCSAGAMSADILMLSKSTEGLFNRIIPESGANLCPITIQINPLENAKNYARNVNFTQVEDLPALEEFYKTAPIDLLIENHFSLLSIFSPCVERDVGEEIILHDTPFNILQRGEYKKLPMLYGFANMDGLLILDNINIWAPKMNDKFSDFLPADLHFDNEERKEAIAATVKDFYFGNKPVGNETVLEYIDYFTDILFAYPALRSVKLQVEAGNNQIYLYEYSFVDDDTPSIPHTTVRGADHCSESLAVLFDSISDYKNHTYIIMKEMWHNFITTSKPVTEGSALPAWPAAGKDGAPHMSIGLTLQLEGSLRQRRAQFWDDIYQHYYRTSVTLPTFPLLGYN